jgi:hypothetical protein
MEDVCGIAVTVTVDDGCHAIENVARSCYIPVIIIRLKAASECHRIGGRFFDGDCHRSTLGDEVVGTARGGACRAKM